MQQGRNLPFLFSGNQVTLQSSHGPSGFRPRQGSSVPRAWGLQARCGKLPLGGKMYERDLQGTPDSRDRTVLKEKAWVRSKDEGC